MAGRSQHRDNRSSYFSSDIGRSGVYDGVNGTPINFSQRGDNPNDLRDTEGISETARESGLYASRIGSTKQPTEDYSKEGMLGSTGNFPRQNWDQSFEEGNRTPESGTYSRNIESNQYDTDYKANNDIGRSSTFDNNRDSGLYNRKIGSFRETIPENSGKDNQRQSSKHFKPNKYIGNTLDTMLEGEDESKQPEHFHSTNYSESRKYSGTARNGDYDGHSNASFQDDKEFPPWAGMMVEQQFTDKYIKTKWPRISLHLTQPRHSDPFVPGKIDEGSICTIDKNSGKDDHKTRNTLCVIGLGTLLLCLVGAAIVTVILLANQSTDKTEYVKVNMTVTVDKIFTSELTDPGSADYKSFTTKFSSEIGKAYKGENSSLIGYYGCKVTSLTNGSIIVTYIIYFTGTTNQQVTLEAVKTILETHLNVSASLLGDLVIVTGSVTVYNVETETLSSPPTVEESATTTTTSITTPHIETTTEIVVPSTVTMSDSETVQTTEATTLNTKQTTIETTSLITSSTGATTPKTVQTTTKTAISTVPPTEDTTTEPKQSTMEITTSTVPPTEDTTTEPKQATMETTTSKVPLTEDTTTETVESTTEPASSLISSTEETTAKTVQSIGETSTPSVSLTDETTPKTVHSTTKIITASSSSTENTTPKTMQTETTPPIIDSTVESMSSQSTNHVSEVTTTLQTDKKTEATQEPTSSKTTPTKESISSTIQEEPTTLTSTISTSSTEALYTSTSDSTERTTKSSNVPWLDTTKTVISTSTDDTNQLITSTPIDDTTKLITSTPTEDTTKLITSTPTDDTTLKIPSTSTEYTTHAEDTTKSATSTSTTKLITSTFTDDTTKPVMSTSTEDTTATVSSTAIVDTTKLVTSTPTEDVTQSGTFTSTEETTKPVTSTPTEDTTKTISSTPTEDNTPSITSISTEDTPTEDTTTKTVSSIPTEGTTLSITATSTSMSTTGRTTSDEITTVSGTTTESQNIGLNCTGSLNGILYSGPVAIVCIIQQSDEFDYIGITHDEEASNSVYGILINKNGTTLQNNVINQDINVTINSISTINLVLTFVNVSCAMEGFYKVALISNMSGEMKESVSRKIQLEVSSPADIPILTLNADQVIDLIFNNNTNDYFRAEGLHQCEGYVGRPPSNLEITITYNNGTSFQTISLENIYLNISKMSDGCRNKELIKFGLRFTPGMVGSKLRCGVKDSANDFTLSEELSLIPRNICSCAVSRSYRAHPTNCRVHVLCIEDGGIMYPTGVSCPSNECRNSITGECTTNCSNAVCEETVPSDLCTTQAPPTTTPAPSPYVNCNSSTVVWNSGPVDMECRVNSSIFTFLNVTYRTSAQSIPTVIYVIQNNGLVNDLNPEDGITANYVDQLVTISILNASCSIGDFYGVIIGDMNGDVDGKAEGRLVVGSNPTDDIVLKLHPDQIADLGFYRSDSLHTCKANVGYPGGEIQIEMLNQGDTEFKVLDVEVQTVNEFTLCSITKTVSFGIEFTAIMEKATLRCGVKSNLFPSEPLIYSNNETVTLIPNDFCEGTNASLNPHLSKCKYYIQCVGDVEYGKECQNNLCFGIKETNGCQFCTSAICPSDITTTSTPETTEPVQSIGSTVLLNTGPGVIVCSVNVTTFSMINVTYRTSPGLEPTLIAVIQSDGNVEYTNSTDLIEVTYTSFTVSIAVLNVSCAHEGYYGVVIDSGSGLKGKSQGKLSISVHPSGPVDFDMNYDQIIDLPRTFNLYTCSGQVGSPMGKIEVEILYDGANDFQTLSFEPSHISSIPTTTNCMVTTVIKFWFGYTSAMYNATIRCKVINEEFQTVSAIYSKNETLTPVPNNFCDINYNGTHSYPNPADPCNRFVTCIETTPYGYQCSKGTCFNPDTGGCGHCRDVDSCLEFV